MPFSTDGSDDDSYTLLQLSALSFNTKQAVTVEVATAGVLKVWVPPCLTVLQMNLWLGKAMAMNLKSLELKFSTSKCVSILTPLDFIFFSGSPNKGDCPIT